MRRFAFDLTPTATYRQRACVWYTSPHFKGDGLLTVTLIHAKAFKVEQGAYEIEEVDPERFGTRRFLVVAEVNDADEPVAMYVVTTGGFRACTCDCGSKGYRRAECKHINAIEFLIAAGKLPVRQLQGA